VPAKLKARSSEVSSVPLPSTTRQRLLGSQALQLTYQLGVPAERQFRVDPLLDRCHSEIL
jgi:hypothetical protein